MEKKMYGGSNRVVKLKKEDAEGIVSNLKGQAFELQEGINEVSYIHEIGTCKINVFFDIIYPVFQKKSQHYVFFMNESLRVDGRGSKKYGGEISTYIENKFDDKEVIYEEFKYSEGGKVEILSGFEVPKSDISKIAGLYKATYACINFIKIEQEENIDTRMREPVELELSDDQNIIRYFESETSYGYRESNATMIREDGIYRYEGELTNINQNYIINRYCKLYTKDTNNKYFIIDNKNRIWEKVSTYTPVNQIEASYEVNNMDFFVVYNNELYSFYNITNRYIINKNFIIYNGYLYEKVDSASIIPVIEKPTPLFETNISSNTPIRGKGLYSLVRLGNKDVVIVPIDSTYYTSSYNGFKLAIYDGKIYSIVGEKEDVGFSNDYNYNRLIVTERPKNSYAHFFECFDEVPSSLKTSKDKEDLRIKFFDTSFKYKKPEFEVGDMVVVTEEFTPDSKIKGLQGIITEISNNKAKLNVKFFNLFELEMDTNQVAKI